MMENAAIPPTMPPARLIKFKLCTFGEGVAVLFNVVSFGVAEVCDTWSLVRVTIKVTHETVCERQCYCNHT